VERLDPAAAAVAFEEASAEIVRVEAEIARLVEEDAGLRHRTDACRVTHNYFRSIGAVAAAADAQQEEMRLAGQSGRTTARMWRLKDVLADLRLARKSYQYAAALKV
jgi:hypothetical protein